MALASSSIGRDTQLSGDGAERARGYKSRNRFREQAGHRADVYCHPHIDGTTSALSSQRAGRSFERLNVELRRSMILLL